jgi:hypothetical protein
MPYIQALGVFVSECPEEKIMTFIMHGKYLTLIVLGRVKLNL